jgi:hypothetical protein
MCTNATINRMSINRGAQMHDWFWRFHLGLPPRSEDRDALRRIAPELFGRDDSALDERNWVRRQQYAKEFRDEIRRWLATEEGRPLVTVHEGTCPQPDCPLKLGGHPGPVSGGAIRSKAAVSDDSLVLELMTVAGGWTAKVNAFFDAARKVHGGKGPVKDLLVTDSYIYADKSEEGTTGGIDNFLRYLDTLSLSQGKTLTIFQPPFAKGKKNESGRIWRRCAEQHAKGLGYSIKFEYFKTTTGSRFHDRFYLARHDSGVVSGLFGPSMNGLNDKSFVLVGELEAMTLKRLCTFIDGWA